jgi:hypothetical protein
MTGRWVPPLAAGRTLVSGLANQVGVGAVVAHGAPPGHLSLLRRPCGAALLTEPGCTIKTSSHRFCSDAGEQAYWARPLVSTRAAGASLASAANRSRPAPWLQVLPMPAAALVYIYI